MSTNKRRKIMVFVDWFEPGFKAGGPIRSCVNFVHHMKDAYDLYVFTSDRDLGDHQPYPGVITDTWSPYAENVSIFYASPRSLKWGKIRNEMKLVNPDFIYLNSMFSLHFSILPLLICKWSQFAAQIILSPRGMLKESALNFKPLKKKAFLQLFRILRMADQIRWHATDETEAIDIKSQFGSGSIIHLVGNYPGVQPPFLPPAEKEIGELKLIFIGRIHPIKNLDYLLSILEYVQEKVLLSIVAPVEDEEYWALCESRIKALPEHIRVHHSGELVHDLVLTKIREHHAFILPTRGENFGHAIFEALSAGRPVIISDQTPWRNLEVKGAGWDIPIRQPQTFIETIRKLAAMNKQELEALCKQAWQFCNGFVNDPSIKNQYLKLFS